MSKIWRCSENWDGQHKQQSDHWFQVDVLVFPEFFNFSAAASVCAAPEIISILELSLPIIQPRYLNFLTISSSWPPAFYLVWESPSSLFVMMLFFSINFDGISGGCFIKTAEFLSFISSTIYKVKALNMTVPWYSSKTSLIWRMFH